MNPDANNPPADDPTTGALRRPGTWDLDQAQARLDPMFRRKNLTADGDLVITPMMRLLAAAMPAYLNQNAAICVSGPVGSGKSTLLQTLAAISDVHTAIVTLPGAKVTDLGVWHSISKAVTGREAGTARDLREHTAGYITVTPTLVLVDEAQFIRRDAWLDLRWLWDRPFNKFAIVLAGSGLEAIVNADEDIASRIDERLTLRRNPRDKMLDYIAQHHTWARQTHPWVLEQLDELHCRGNWRAWSKVLRKLDRVGHTGPITVRDAELALLSITGRIIKFPLPPANLDPSRPLRA